MRKERTFRMLRLVFMVIVGVIVHFYGFTVEKPNIIIIFNDDQGYQDLGSYGSPDIKTPRVDQMAREGMRFTDFYVASPVCSPSRAALLTGSNPQRVGVRGVFWPNKDHGLNPQHVTIAEVLKEAGYRTAAVGKWHLGHKLQYLPTNQGFDSYYGIPYSNDMYPDENMEYAEDCLWLEGFSPEMLAERFSRPLDRGQPREFKNKVPLMRNEACIEFPTDQTTVTRRYADESIEFITQSAATDQPFFLYLANTMPHVPLFTEERFRGVSEQGPYGDAVEEIDFHTGRILDHLRKTGIDDNTIVIFTSDNGPWLGRAGGKDAGSALPLFEGKFTTFEGGVRVPFIVRWPGQVPAGTVSNEVASSLDLLPTLAGIAGAQVPKEIDGKDILDLWTNEGAQSPHDYLYFSFKGKSVRHKEWKYHKNQFYQYNITARDDEGPALYNLKVDIGETTNVMYQYPGIARQLDQTLSGYLQEEPTNFSVKSHEQGDINILFIGNSFTFRHELNLLVEEIVNEGHPNLNIYTERSVYGGQSLFQHSEYYYTRTFIEQSTIEDAEIEGRISEMENLLELTEAPEEFIHFWEVIRGQKVPEFPKSNIKNAIKRHRDLLANNPGKKWDYVVLQTWQDEYPDLNDGYAKYAKYLGGIAREQGAKVIFYMTAPDFQNEAPVAGPVKQEDYEKKLNVILELAKEFQPFAVIPVPMAINMIQQEGTDLTFRYENDFHPNQRTAFLTANMFYSAIFGESTEGFSFNTVTETKTHTTEEQPNVELDPDGGPATMVFQDEEKTFLQQIAYSAVMRFVELWKGEGPIPVLEISIVNTPSDTIDLGNNYQLFISLKPLYATNKNVKWEVTSGGAVTVDENGLVKAVAEGRAIVKVTTVDGGLSDSCVINVKKK